MKNKTLIWLSAAVLSGVLLSCNQVPQQEIDAANLSMQMAKSAGADLYLPLQYDALQDSMGAVMEALEAKKSNMFAKYGDIRDQLNVLAITANQLTDSTEAEKLRISDEIRFTMEQIQVLIQETRMLLAEAPKGKEGRLAIEAINNDLSTVESNVNEANGMFDKGQLLESRQKVVAARERLLAINGEVKEAIAQYEKKQPKRG